MAESVRDLPEDLDEIMEVREWDMRTREGITRFKELKAKILPSIVMDGDLVYESLIPPPGRTHRRDPAQAPRKG